MDTNPTSIAGRYQRVKELAKDGSDRDFFLALAKFTDSVYKLGFFDHEDFKDYFLLTYEQKAYKKLAKLAHKEILKAKNNIFEGLTSEEKGRNKRYIKEVEWALEFEAENGNMFGYAEHELQLILFDLYENNNKKLIRRYPIKTRRIDENSWGSEIIISKKWREFRDYEKSQDDFHALHPQFYAWKELMRALIEISKISEASLKGEVADGFYTPEMRRKISPNPLEFGKGDIPDYFTKEEFFVHATHVYDFFIDRIDNKENLSEENQNPAITSKQKLSNCTVRYEKNDLTLYVNEKPIDLSNANYMNILCDLLFQYDANTPVEWEECYEAMKDRSATNELDDNAKTLRNKEKRVVRDAMRRIHGEIWKFTLDKKPIFKLSGEYILRLY